VIPCVDSVVQHSAVGQTQIRAKVNVVNSLLYTGFCTDMLESVVTTSEFGICMHISKMGHISVFFSETLEVKLATILNSMQNLV